MDVDLHWSTWVAHTDCGSRKRFAWVCDMMSHSWMRWHQASVQSPWCGSIIFNSSRHSACPRRKEIDQNKHIASLAAFVCGVRGVSMQIQNTRTQLSHSLPLWRLEIVTPQLLMNGTRTTSFGMSSQLFGENMKPRAELKWNIYSFCRYPVPVWSRWIVLTFGGGFDGVRHIAAE